MIWDRGRKKRLREAVKERKTSEENLEEAKSGMTEIAQLQAELRKIGEENHLANAVIEMVLRGYDK